jgi:hypothetical protein
MKKMPELKRIYDKWRAKGLEVVGLNFDKDVETAETAVKSHEIPWPTVHVPADKEIRDLWDEATRISALPRILVIDQQGILRADLASPDTEKNLENRIAELVQGSSAPPDGTAEKSATNK